MDKNKMKAMITRGVSALIVLSALGVLGYNGFMYLRFRFQTEGANIVINQIMQGITRVGQVNLTKDFVIVRKP